MAIATGTTLLSTLSSQTTTTTMTKTTGRAHTAAADVKIDEIVQANSFFYTIIN